MYYKELIGQMTLKEKASLCLGFDFWNLKSIERLAITPFL
jgi:beta-glucosidase